MSYEAGACDSPPPELQQQEEQFRMFLPSQMLADWFSACLGLKVLVQFTGLSASVAQLNGTAGWSSAGLPDLQA